MFFHETWWSLDGWHHKTISINIEAGLAEQFVHISMKLGQDFGLIFDASRMARQVNRGDRAHAIVVRVGGACGFLQPFFGVRPEC